MKTHVLIISENFPKTHKRAGERTNFALSIMKYRKIHTLRANYEYWKKKINEVEEGKAILSIRIWTGKPYRSDQKEIFRLDQSDGVGIQKLQYEAVHSFSASTITTGKLNLLGYKPMLHSGGKPVICLQIDQLAKNDGLSIDDFKEWFSTYDMSKVMAIIYFTKYRYK